MATYNFGSGETYATYAAARSAAEVAEPSPFTANVIIQGKGTFEASFFTGTILNPTATFRFIIRAIPGETLTLDGNDIVNRGLGIQAPVAHVDFEDITAQECTERCLDTDGDDSNVRRCTLNYNPTTETGVERGCVRFSSATTNWTFEDCTFTHGTANTGWFSFAAGQASNDIVFKRCSLTGKLGDVAWPTAGSEGDEAMRFENCTFIYRSGDTGDFMPRSGKFAFRFCSFLVLADATCLRLADGAANGMVARNCVFHMQVGGTGHYANIGGPTRAFLTMDNNDIYKVGPRFAQWEAVNQDTFAAWKTASGKDAASIVTDPALVSTVEGSENLRIRKTSPARQAGAFISGIAK